MPRIVASASGEFHTRSGKAAPTPRVTWNTPPLPFSCRRRSACGKSATSCPKMMMRSSFSISSMSARLIMSRMGIGSVLVSSA